MRRDGARHHEPRASARAAASSLPSTCFPLQHLATLEDGSLLCHHEGFRLWLTHEEVLVSEPGPTVRDAAPVEGGWVFSCDDDVARFATTPVGPWRSLGPMPSNDWPSVAIPPDASGQRGALLTANGGRVYEANATGVRVHDVPFPVRRALAFGEQRLLLSDHGVVAFGTWSALRVVPLVYGVLHVDLDDRGPILYFDGAGRRLDGTEVPLPSDAPVDDAPMARLLERAHAASPFLESVVRAHDGAVAAVIGTRLVIRRGTGAYSVRLPSDWHHGDVLRGDLGGWHVSGADGEILRITDDGVLESRWPPTPFRDLTGWVGSCAAPRRDTELVTRGPACVLDSRGRPTELELAGWPYAQCGDLVYMHGRSTTVHDLVSGERTTFAEPPSGTCGLGNTLVDVHQEDGGTGPHHTVLRTLGRRDEHVVPVDRATRVAASPSGEVVVDGDVAVHSLDAGRTWRHVELGERVDCSTIGCFTNHPTLGYVPVADVPTAPEASPPSEPPDPSVRWSFDDDWVSEAPFELDCTRRPTRERPSVRWAAGRLEVVTETTRWSAPLERTALPYITLAVSDRAVVLGAACGRVLLVTPDRVVALPRPALFATGHDGCDLDVAFVQARLESEGTVATLWSTECVTVAARFAATGRLLHARRLLVMRDDLVDLAMRDGRAGVAYLLHDRGEVVPLDPNELPRWLRLPPPTRWTPRVCSDDFLGTELTALWLPDRRVGVKLRIDDRGDVCVAGSADGLRAQRGSLVRLVREGRSWLEERCTLRARP